MPQNLSSKREIKGVLQEYGVYPSKKLGQNFIVDRSVVKKFLKAADLNPKDTVLEIGPGPGNLTQEIAGSVKKVIAVEKDPMLVRILKDKLRIKDITNVEVIEGDILKIPHPISERSEGWRRTNVLRLFNLPHSYKVMGNLPFYLTSPVIRKFLESKNPPEQMVFFVQKEVAQRIAARPPDMSLLAVSVQFYAKPEIAGYVSKKSFWPQPKVDSAILRIAPLINTDRKLINADLFFQIVRAGFSQPRKQILNNLSKKLSLDKKMVENWLLKNKVEPLRRAETLEIKDWIRLTQSPPF